MVTQKKLTWREVYRNNGRGGIANRSSAAKPVSPAGHAERNSDVP